MNLIVIKNIPNNNIFFSSLLLSILSIIYIIVKFVSIKKEKKKGFNGVPGNWFTEMCDLWPGQAFSLKIKKVLCSKDTTYQHIDILDCGEKWGRVLALDGLIQLTEHDECAYHEMMSHIPMFSHPNPKKVAIIGGGDGGILREISRHSIPENIYFCEIDLEVMNLCKEFFPKISSSFNEPRAYIKVQDGLEFLRNFNNELDIIIVDSSDPIGPGESLFTELFFSVAFQALTDNGILCSQGECMWISVDNITKMMKTAKNKFPCVEYCSIHVPSYPCGSIGLLLSCKNPQFKASVGHRLKNNNSNILSQLNYYTPDLHFSAFQMPPFVSREIEKI